VTARKIKFEDGQRRYGPVFQGDPLNHAYEELADALNYMDEFEKQQEGKESLVEQSKLVRFHLLASTTILRRMHQSNGCGGKNGGGNGRI
jgi:hypothetical protein